MWCEMGSCISWYTDQAALGEADTRARAVAAGWRIDAVGRLVCPSCQQTDPCFWASLPGRAVGSVRGHGPGRPDRGVSRRSDRTAMVVHTSQVADGPAAGG